MSGKHTPGPWAIKAARDGSGDVGIVANGVANVIAECFAAMRHASECATEEARANAQLIAAAPDLLEALKDALAGWRYIREHHGDLYGVGWDRVEEAARAAIARATGEQG